MDPENNLQDIVRCTVCETLEASMYCWTCDVNLCKDCIEEHLSDKLKSHTVMLIKHKRFTPKYRRCEKHPQEHYEFVCQKCHNLLCKQCIVSNEEEEFNTQKEILKEDFADMVNILMQHHQNMLRPTPNGVEEFYQNIQRNKDLLESHRKNLTSEHMVTLEKGGRKDCTVYFRNKRNHRIHSKYTYTSDTICRRKLPKAKKSSGQTWR